MTEAGSDPRRRVRRWKRIALGVVIVAGVTYAANGPYVFPVSWGLGPCFKDWTSPSSYLPRASPLVTVEGSFENASVRVCYGAPSARGRTLFGDSALVPFGSYWRTGANEPTRLFTDTPLDVAGIDLEPGRYSIYTVPGPDHWEVIANRSTFHWGYDFSDGVLAQEVGRTRVPVLTAPTFVETFDMSWTGGSNTALAFSWGTVLVEVPVRVNP